MLRALRRGRFAVPFVFLVAAAAFLLAQNAEDWASSPEAYFLTPAEKRIRRARMVANEAIKQASTEAADDSRHRATRTRRAYHTKAQALDRVLEILNGKA